MEVVFALAIFLFSLTAIIELMSFAGASVMEASVRSQAALLCQSKIAQVIAGEQSLGSTGYAAFPDSGDGPSNPGYEWRLQSEAHDGLPGLYLIEVFVKKDVPGRGAIEVNVSQMIMDPSKKGSTLDNPIPATASN